MAKIEEIVGRTAETKAILNSTKPEFVAVYGRRRVGKTFLIQEVYKKNIIFKFTGARGFETEAQLNNFYKEFIRQTKPSNIVEPPQSWLTAFDLLANFAEKLLPGNLQVINIMTAHKLI